MDPIRDLFVEMQGPHSQSAIAVFHNLGPSCKFEHVFAGKGQVEPEGKVLAHSRGLWIVFEPEPAFAPIQNGMRGIFDKDIGISAFDALASTITPAEDIENVASFIATFQICLSVTTGWSITWSPADPIAGCARVAGG